MYILCEFINERAKNIMGKMSKSKIIKKNLIFLFGSALQYRVIAFIFFVRRVYIQDSNSYNTKHQCYTWGKESLGLKLNTITTVQHLECQWLGCISCDLQENPSSALDSLDCRDFCAGLSASSLEDMAVKLIQYDLLREPR